MKPLVSVVCVCYNHERFVGEAINSVLIQTYPNVELVVVDNSSTDGSVTKIRSALTSSVDTKVIISNSNQGNCKAFNEGFKKTVGDFIIDLSADDVLSPQRIEKGIANFQRHDSLTGVNFTDAELIDESGNGLGFHSDRFPHTTIPEGDIYLDVLSRYFINSPTMMIRRTVLEKLGGFDETLAYEDFDLLIRSARDFRFSYIPEPLVKRRVVKNSLGSLQYKHGSAQLHSTLKVCEKAAALNRTIEENNALKIRLRYEIRRVLTLGEFRLALRYWSLYRRL